MPWRAVARGPEFRALAFRQAGNCRARRQVYNNYRVKNAPRDSRAILESATRR
jgi:hypothetical protein